MIEKSIYSHIITVILQSLLFVARGSVILSGEPYCGNSSSDDVSFAAPGTKISITCVTDSPDGIAPSLAWEVVSITLGHGSFQAGDMVSEQGFFSRINSANSTEGTANATLTFSAKSDIDGTVVECRGAQLSATSSCTLFILTPPTAPTSSICVDITNNSLTLQWSEPTDNGGEEELQYNITVTPGNISIVESGNIVTVENLLPNTTYDFRIRAGNSVGFGSETSVECTTEENRPPMFDCVMVCLGVSDISPDCVAEMAVIYLPCPLVTDQFTPVVTSYRVVVGGSDILAEDSSTCDFSMDISTDDMSAFTVDVYANNSVGSTKTSYRNGGKFYASWIRDVSVIDVTSSSAVIQYTTADCVLSTDLIVELITPNSSMVDSDTTHHYMNETTSSFSFTSLTPNDVVSFTLQVTVASTTVYSTTSSFTAVPTTTSLVPSSSGTSSTVLSSKSITVPTCQCCPVESTIGLSSSVSASITLAISVPVTAVISVLLTVLVMYLCFLRKPKELKSPTTTGEPYETPVSVKTTGFELKGNEAYGQVKYTPTTVYDTVNQ